MRIITGQFKGRHFDIPRTFKARPTTDFAKENILNVLNGYIDFDGITALDLFAGTGSISLELVSRGCKEVVSVEKDRDHARFIADCMKKINTENDILIRGDVFRFLPPEVRPHLCRPAVCAARTRHPSQPRIRARPAHSRWRVRL